MKYIIIIGLFLFSINNFIAQDKNQQTRSNLSFGLTFGYKTDGGSFVLQGGYLIKRIIDINVHFGANKYEGGAYGVGIKGFILPKQKFKPYIGLTYDYCNSGGSGFALESKTTRSVYATGINSVILFQGGILYEEQPLSLFVSLNYKTTYPGNHLILIDGIPDAGTENEAEKIYAPGLGVTVGIIFHWWSKTKPKENQAQF